MRNRYTPPRRVARPLVASPAPSSRRPPPRRVARPLVASPAPTSRRPPPRRVARPLVASPAPSSRRPPPRRVARPSEGGREPYDVAHPRCAPPVLPRPRRPDRVPRPARPGLTPRPPATHRIPPAPARARRTDPGRRSGRRRRQELCAPVRRPVAPDAGGAGLARRRIQVGRSCPILGSGNDPVYGSRINSTVPPISVSASLDTMPSVPRLAHQRPAFRSIGRVHDTCAQRATVVSRAARSQR